MQRFHPCSTGGKHKGTDYAAPTGTPITTTASGVVEKQDTRLEMEITLSET
jgi:murein DD-endopeptidase MepM/ murein hydrolase activator NlpD